MNKVTMEEPMEEPILISNPDRFVLFPIVHQDLWELYEEQEKAMWTVKELDIAQDISHWKSKLTDNERFFIKNVLAFFAASDGIVNENLAVNFLKAFPVR